MINDFINNFSVRYDKGNLPYRTNIAGIDFDWQNLIGEKISESSQNIDNISPTMYFVFL